MLKSFFEIVVLEFFPADCNTIQGMGKDVEKGGEATERSAK